MERGEKQTKRSLPDFLFEIPCFVIIRNGGGQNWCSFGRMAIVTTRPHGLVGAHATSAALFWSSAKKLCRGVYDNLPDKKLCYSSASSSAATCGNEETTDACRSGSGRKRKGRSMAPSSNFEGERYGHSLYLTRATSERMSRMSRTFQTRSRCTVSTAHASLHFVMCTSIECLSLDPLIGSSRCSNNRRADATR